MLEKLKGVENRFLKIEKLLSDPKILDDLEAYQKYSREHADLNKIVTPFREYERTLTNLDDAMDLLKEGDPDIKDLAKEEINSLTLYKDKLEKDLTRLLIPKNPLDEKNVIVKCGPAQAEKRQLCLQMTCSECTAGMLKARTGKWKF